MNGKDDFRVLVHTPAELAQEYIAWAESIKAGGGIPFGVKSIDEKMIPIRPGELVSIIARPGHGKTSILAYLARQEAKRIVARQNENGIDEHNECVVYCTWEQSAEELEAFFQAEQTASVSDIAWGRADLETIRRQSVARARMPIWVIGHGIGRAGRKAPRMTPDAVIAAIETMYDDYGVKPTLVLFDYMQLIPVGNARDRIQQVTEVPLMVKELALRIGVPAVVGVQAGRDVDNRQEKIPEMRDAQWASSIEQTSDKVFGLWRPYQTEDEGTLIDVGGKAHQNTERLLVMRMLKQRGDIGRFTWALYFAPQYLQLGDLETAHSYDGW